MVVKFGSFSILESFKMVHINFFVVESKMYRKEAAVHCQRIVVA